MNFVCPIHKQENIDFFCLNSYCKTEKILCNQCDLKDHMQCQESNFIEPCKKFFNKCKNLFQSHLSQIKKIGEINQMALKNIQTEYDTQSKHLNNLYIELSCMINQIEGGLQFNTFANFSKETLNQLMHYRKQLSSQNLKELYDNLNQRLEIINMQRNNNLQNEKLIYKELNQTLNIFSSSSQHHQIKNDVNFQMDIPPHKKQTRKVFNEKIEQTLLLNDNGKVSNQLNNQQQALFDMFVQQQKEEQKSKSKMDEEIVKCQKCGVEKPLNSNNFYPRGNKLEGFRKNLCKQCYHFQNIAQKKNKKKPEQTKSRSRINHLQIQQSTNVKQSVEEIKAQEVDQKEKPNRNKVREKGLEQLYQQNQKEQKQKEIKKGIKVNKTPIKELIKQNDLYCKQCKKTKPIEEFYKSQSKCKCKSCVKNQIQTYRKKQRLYKQQKKQENDAIINNVDVQQSKDQRRNFQQQYNDVKGVIKTRFAHKQLEKLNKEIIDQQIAPNGYENFSKEIQQQQNESHFSFSSDENYGSGNESSFSQFLEEENQKLCTEMQEKQKSELSKDQHVAQNNISSFTLNEDQKQQEQ